MFEETQEQKNEKYMNNVKFIAIVIGSFIASMALFVLGLFWYYDII